MPGQPKQQKPQPGILKRAVDWIEHEAEGLTPEGWAAHTIKKQVPAALGQTQGKPKAKPRPFGPFAKIEGALSGGKPNQ